MDKKFKIFVIVAIMFLTLITVAGGVTVFFMMSGSNNKEAQEKAQKEAYEIVYLGESVNSNLKIGEDNIPHIIRVSVGFQIDSKDKSYKSFMSDFTNEQIVIRDKIISLLRGYTYDEINEEVLRGKIKDEVNRLLDTEIIKNVYFNDLFVQ